MESSSISEFYRGRSVLVTGASGFIGKQLVEKLLRSCPDVDKIYLLLRPTRFYTAPARLQYILSSPVYYTPFHSLTIQSRTKKERCCVAVVTSSVVDLFKEISLLERLLNFQKDIFH